ncbi:unnamed protein product, partial [Laminaria digitata]
MQVATSASTAVLLTVLNALEQSATTSQWLAPCSARIPKLLHLAVDLLQPRRDHYRIAPARMGHLHVMPTQTHLPPSAMRLDCKKSFQNSAAGTRQDFADDFPPKDCH